MGMVINDGIRMEDGQRWELSSMMGLGWRMVRVGGMEMGIESSTRIEVATSTKTPFSKKSKQFRPRLCRVSPWS